MSAGGYDRSFSIIEQACFEYFESQDGRAPLDVVFHVMDDTNFPMHNFAHHYLVPAVLLSAVYAERGVSFEKFSADMKLIAERAHNVLPAFCGFYGACGAAVGCGIFMSVFTGTTPLSKDTWGLCNGATAGALTKMAEIGGPRCCKRNTFSALVFMKEYLGSRMSIDINIPSDIKCRYSKFNKECLESACPFFER